MSPVLPTDPARWRRIESVLDLALDLSSAERSALLDESCVGDPGLRAEVEAVLAADAQAGGFLVTPAGDYAPDLLADAVEEEEGEPDLSGHQMGPYRLLREIGGGGMGTVYEAEDTRLGRRVAVKLLPPEYSRDRRAKERFLREARAAAAVDHPNLCTIHDVGESDGRLYIVLSFYEGETLRERIRRGPLPLAEARDVAIQVARGLARVHEAGIVHRDIKPANVMLTRRGEAKILDFGIARLEGDKASLTRTGASWGTPAYMSPEQACGEPVDGRTDVWSLGVMLYEMLAGRRPFGGDSLEAVVSAILTREPEPLERVRPDVPPELAWVVERALAKDPAERYASAAELLEDLEVGRAPGRRRWRRRALGVGLLASALVLLVIILLCRPWRFMAGPPLRVAVLKPIVESVKNDADLAFLASDIVGASHSALLTLDGLQPLDPPERNEEKGPETQRLLEADEVLLPLLSCRGDSCQVTLSRRKSRGEILKTSEPFEVQGDFENAFQLAEGVRVHVQQVYSDHRLRSERSGATVSPQDYSSYVELQRRVDSGGSLGETELNRLDSLLQTSPGLIGVYVLATGIARRLGDIDRALDYVARAEELAPYDPRPLLARLEAELVGKRLGAAQETLARLEDLAPGDTRVKTARAALLEARGEYREARSLREEVAWRRPTWRNVLMLATLEVSMGATESARRHLEELLATHPENQYVLDSLAALETIYGDLSRAARLYEKLIRMNPAPHLIRNLGMTYYLLDDYAAAAAADRTAVALNPNDPWSRFNLATALEAQGDLTGAKGLYRSLADELAAAPPQDQRNGLLHAQCLVRLGQQLDATRLADEILSQRPEDVQDLHQAAQLYVILGKPNLAYYYMELALAKGLGREWFTIPEFRSLDEKDPQFRDLLGRHTAPRRKS
jgi:serine/threonine protein kinase/tetratricopeptide (TPR) repeat protein